MLLGMVIFRVFCCLFLFILSPAQAAHGLALGYTPKYPANFQHFDYVNPNAPHKGRLTLGEAGDFDKLNPFSLKGAAASGISGLIYESLLTKSLDEPFSAYALLADDVELAADGLSVRFHLNPRARFSDGSPVQAADVKYTFDTLLHDTAAHPQFAFYYADVKQVVVQDALTIRFEFARKNPELHLIIGDVPIFPRKWGAGKAFKDRDFSPPLGSGPYLLADYQLGKFVRYQRNPHYWGNLLPTRRGTFNFNEVVYRYYKDETIRLEAFKAGEFDFIAENSAKQWATGYKGEKFSAGKIIRRSLAHENGGGIQGFGMNLRLAKFQDRRVRQALGLALDFEWSNRNLFYGQYVRNKSYFDNSELAARGLPSPEELALLNPFRAQLSPAVFAAPALPPSTAVPQSLRENLRQARALLQAAGWTYQHGALRNAKGEAFTIELLIYSPIFERIAAPYQRNLEKLGIVLSTRLADSALYQRRMDNVEYEMAVMSIGQSQSPGNEQLGYFHSKSADKAGSNNALGIKNKVVDALVENLIQAPNRHALITACRALDRVLWSEYYMVPQWGIPYHRVAYWNKFQQPARLPRYYDASGLVLETWWAK